MITLYKNYKYDNRYDYIKTFETVEQQEQYFDSLEQINLDLDYNYIRENKSLNIEFSHEYLTINNINYLQFNNGYKDMYAFIIQKNYINDEVTELIFEIDVIQTFMFDFNINKSFIERKKCYLEEVTDFDEGLNLGEHIVEYDKTVFEKDSKYFALFNGIKEQQILVDSDGTIKDVIDLPFPTSKPLTNISGIPYPLYFVPLKNLDEYEDTVITNIDMPTYNVSRIIKSAEKCLGKPYLWGDNLDPLHLILPEGGTGRGTDCSGLVQWCYYDSDIMTSLGGRWTTNSMYPYCVIATINSVKAGDVVFCSWASDRMTDISEWQNGLPGHVMIFEKITYDGETKTIHVIEASSGAGIIKRSQHVYNENKMTFGKVRQ